MTVDELRKEMLEMKASLKTDIAAVERRINDDLQSTDDSLKRLRETILGNGTSGLSQRLSALEVLLAHNADAVKELKESIRYYFRWCLATGVMAIISMGTSGIAEVIKLWAQHK